MNKRDLLLEIGLEEMPARFVSSSIEQLKEKIAEWLSIKKINYDEIKGYSTPRRLAVLVTSVEEMQPDAQEEAKGPAKKIALDQDGNWSKAAIGFSRGQGLKPEDIYFKELNGVEYAHVNKFIKGQATIELLPELEKVITGLTFPKNMRWADEELRFIRPIKWLVALFGEEVIPFGITNVETDRFTQGHRFLGNKITIHHPSDYVNIMLEQFVIVDAQNRKEAILSQLQHLEEENNWNIPVDQDLLEEVNNLVEYPTALYGQFSEEFLELPEEVLITSMKEHQRYFPVKDLTGKLLPFFVTVRNGDHQHLEKVAKGNEKVLRARLSDADFFFKEDKKMEINTALNKLKSIVYHEEIGTLAEKVERIGIITNSLTSLLPFSTEEKEAAKRAAEICKFDLVTHMVYEFPELQGFMGEKYALQKGESTLVAKAINEHYMPRHAEDETPSTRTGAVISIADKLDTIVACFAIGIIPTGSQDPYALRRQSLGIVQILLDQKWEITLEDLLEKGLKAIVDLGIAKRNEQEIVYDLLHFFKLRIKHILQEKNIRYDIIEAVLDGNIGIVSKLIKRAEVLQSLKDQDDFKVNIETLSRVLNISSKLEGVSKVDSTLFENQYEQSLFDQYINVKKQLLSIDNEQQYFEELISLSSAINEYFNHTMVMAEQNDLRQNRLSQMSELANIIRPFANMNLIVVK